MKYFAEDFRNELGTNQVRAEILEFASKKSNGIGFF